jgi:hypothetical protein
MGIQLQDSRKNRENNSILTRRLEAVMPKRPFLTLFQTMPNGDSRRKILQRTENQHLYHNTVQLRIFGIDFRYVETLHCNVSCIGFGA